MKKYLLLCLSFIWLLCISCATQLNNLKQNLDQLKPDEGIVFGSILLTNDLASEKKHGEAYLLL